MPVWNYILPIILIAALIGLGVAAFFWPWLKPVATAVMLILAALAAGF